MLSFTVGAALVAVLLLACLRWVRTATRAAPTEEQKSCVDYLSDAPNIFVITSLSFCIWSARASMESNFMSSRMRLMN